jgi:hypothetical protein
VAVGTYVYDRAVARYRDARGRFVALAEIRAEIDRALSAASRRLELLAGDLRAGRLSLTAWRSVMRDAVKDVHLYSAAAARGGWAQMDAAAYGQVGGIVRGEYQYLEDWARAIADGEAPLDGRLTSRAGLYAERGRYTYHLAERDVQEELGRREERNVLHVAEHCEGTGSCIEQTEAGWVELGTLLAVGERLCGPRCRCTIEYR